MIHDDYIREIESTTEPVAQRRFAARMLGMRADEVTAVEVTDAGVVVHTAGSSTPVIVVPTWSPDALGQTGPMFLRAPRPAAAAAGFRVFRPAAPMPTAGARPAAPKVEEITTVSGVDRRVREIDESLAVIDERRSVALSIEELAAIEGDQASMRNERQVLLNRRAAIAAQEEQERRQREQARRDAEDHALAALVLDVAGAFERVRCHLEDIAARRDAAVDAAPRDRGGDPPRDIAVRTWRKADELAQVLREGWESDLVSWAKATVGRRRRFGIGR